MEKIDWVIRFRRAKQKSTLKVMFEGALNKAASIREQADIILAHEARELEIEENKYVMRSSSWTR